MDYLNEKLLISYLLHNTNKLHEVNTDEFIAKESKAIVEAIKEYNQKDLSFSFSTLTALARKHDETIDFSLIESIYNTYQDFTNLSYHQTLQSDIYLKNVVQNNIFETIYSDTKKQGKLDRDKLLKNLDKVKTIVSDHSDQKSFYTTTEWMDLHRRGDQDRQNDKFPKTSGYPTLDRKMGSSFLAGDFVTTAAPPGMGKSIFTMNMIYQWITKGYPVLSLNTEMGEVVNADRLIGLVGGIPNNEIIKRDRSEEVSILIEKTRQTISSIPNLFYSSQESLYIDDIDRMISLAKEKFMDLGVWNHKNPYMILTLDLFDLLLDIKRKSPDEIGKAIDDFHRMLRKHKINGLPYVAGDVVTQIGENLFRDTSFRNRFSTPDDLDNFVFTAFDIFGSSAFNQRTRLMFTLSRPSHLKTLFFPEESVRWEEDPKENYIIVNIAKNNYGGVGTVKFWFNPKTGKISPIVENYNDQERLTR